MDNYSQAPGSFSYRHSKSILYISITIILVMVCFAVYYFVKIYDRTPVVKEATYDEKIRALEALRVTPPEGVSELTEAEKINIMQNLRVKSTPVKGAKPLTASEKEAILNSLE